MCKWKVENMIPMKCEASSNVDVSKGTYMPFACIVREEGNDDAGMTVAINYVQACQEMAGVWKKTNLQTKRAVFLYMRQEVREIFEHSWKVFEKHQLGTGHQKPGGPAPGNGASTLTGSTVAAVDTLRKQKENASKPKATDAVTGSTEAVSGKEKASQPKPNDLDCTRNPYEIAWQDALDTRKMYMWVTSKIALVIKEIKTNKDWQWARGYYQEEIMQIGDPVTELATTGFAWHFMTQELQNINLVYNKNDLLIHTLQLCKDFDIVLRKANRLLNRLNTMQKESMK
jgi:hypothetical protein